MHHLICILAMFVGLTSSVSAQHSQPRRDPIETQTDINSDAKAEETRRLIEKARERQKGVDRHNSNLWERWIYAVCVGCGWTPKNVRIVYTNPARVLAGVPAAEDDSRGRSAAVSQSEDDLGPLPTNEVKQQSPPRREHVASTLPQPLHGKTIGSGAGSAGISGSTGSGASASRSWSLPRGHVAWLIR